MKIGTMNIEIYGELLYERAIEDFIISFTPILKTIADTFEFDYRRFAFYAATLKLIIPLRIFWKSDAFYNSLIRSLENHFNNWEFNVILYISERKD